MNDFSKVAVALCAVALVSGCASHRSSGSEGYPGHKSSAAKHMTDCNGYVHKNSGVLTMAHPVHFEFGKSDVHSKYNRLLSCIAMSSKKVPVQVRLTGYTDAVGSQDYNMALGRWRADAVKNHLVNYGANGRYIYVYSLGEQKPIATNRTEKGREYNRRVEFNFIPIFPSNEANND